MADTKRTITIEINGKEVEDSLQGIGKEIGRINRELRKTTDPTERAKLNKQLQETRKRYGEIKQEINGVQNEIKDTDKEASALAESFLNIFNGFKSGNPEQIKQGFDGIKGGIQGVTRAAIAFIATPIGAAIAALVGIGAASKAWLDYNGAVVEALRLTQQITSLSDQAADEARIRAETLSEVFETDFKENLETARALVTQFGISYDEAFDVIEENLIRGQKNNDEFFDSLQEYPTFFARAGFSANEFGNLIAAGYDLGFFNDKLPDAIKEATLSLEEQTKSSRDALENAFGTGFTNRILSGIERGTLSVKDALSEIAAEAERTGLNAQQAQQLTADLFRGAGEDAGGALKVLEAYNLALNEQQRELTESEMITRDQVAATEELKRVSSALFATGDQGFGLLIDRARLFGTRVLVRILTGVVDLINFFVDLNNKSATFSAIVTAIGKVFTFQFRIISLGIQSLGEGFKGLGDIIEGIFTLDGDAIENGFRKVLQTSLKFTNDVKNQALQDFQEVKDAFNGENKLEPVKLEFSTVANEGSGAGTGNTGTGGGDNNGLSEADKKVLASRKKLAELLDQFERERKAKKDVEDLDELTQKQIQEEIDLQEKFLKLEEQAEGEKELLARLEEEKQFRLLEIRDKFADLRAEKAEEENKKERERTKKQNDILARGQEELEQAKADAVFAGINILQGFAKEGSRLYKALFFAEKTFAASQVLIKGFEERAKIAAAYAAIPGAAAPFLLASRIRTGIALATIASQTFKGFYDGGPTGNKVIFPDQHGGAVGYVHKNEYVVPEAMTSDPRYADTLTWLESERKQRLGKFNDGGETTPNTIPSQNTNPDNSQLMTAVNRLNQLLDNGVKAYVVMGFEEADRITDLQNQINDSKNKSTIA